MRDAEGGFDPPSSLSKLNLSAARNPRYPKRSALRSTIIADKLSVGANGL